MKATQIKAAVLAVLLPESIAKNLPDSTVDAMRHAAGMAADGFASGMASMLKANAYAKAANQAMRDAWAGLYASDMADRVSPTALHGALNPAYTKAHSPDGKPLNRAQITALRDAQDVDSEEWAEHDGALSVLRVLENTKAQARRESGIAPKEAQAKGGKAAQAKRGASPAKAPGQVVKASDKAPKGAPEIDGFEVKLPLTVSMDQALAGSLAVARHFAATRPTMLQWADYEKRMIAGLKLVIAECEKASKAA